MTDFKTVAVLFAVAVVLATMAIPVASALSEDEEQIFYSGDDDDDPKDLPDSADLGDPATFADVGDVAYRSTKPAYSVDGTSVREFRDGQIQEMRHGLRQSRNPTVPDENFSYEHPDTGNLRNWNYVKDAHATYLGTHGGATPRMGGTGSRTYIGESGVVLSLVDYRVDVPNDHCDEPSFTHEWMDIDGDDADEYVHTSGTMDCYEYSMTTSVDREVEIGGADFAGDRTVEYSGLSGQTAELQVLADIHVEIEETNLEKDWDGVQESEPSESAFSTYDTETSQYADNTRTVESETHDVRITDNGELDVEQKVIRLPDGTSFVVLEFTDVPNGGFSTGELENRRLWASITFDGRDTDGDGTAEVQPYVQGIWRTYSMKRSGGSGTAHVRSSTSSPGDTPRALDQYLFATTQNVSAYGAGGTTEMTVVNTEKVEYNGNSGSTHNDVNMTAQKPVLFRSIAVSNAPSAAKEINTIHGTSYSLPTSGSDFTEVEYRRPDITIQRASGDQRVRIHVEDPQTGDPLDRTLQLSGTQQNSVQTGSDGTVVVDRVNTLVKVTVEGDSLISISPSDDYYYAQASDSRAFLSHVLLLERSYQLVQTAVFVAPLVFLFFYVRQFGFFE